MCIWILMDLNLTVIQRPPNCQLKFPVKFSGYTVYCVLYWCITAWHSVPLLVQLACTHASWSASLFTSVLLSWPICEEEGSQTCYQVQVLREKVSLEWSSCWMGEPLGSMPVGQKYHWQQQGMRTCQTWMFVLVLTCGEPCSFIITFF